MLEQNQILVDGPDHSYVVCDIEQMQVVFDVQSQTFSQYVGDECLEEGQVVVFAKIAF